MGLFDPLALAVDSGASSATFPLTDFREAGAADEAGFDLVDAGLALLVGASTSGEAAARFLPFGWESGLREAVHR